MKKYQYILKNNHVKNRLFLFLFVFSALFAFSQEDKNYYVFAYGQVQSGNNCYQKVGFINEYRAYTAVEANGKAEELRAELKATYKESKGYINIYVELVRPGEVMIVFEGVRVVAGENCTMTYYGAVVAGTPEDAELKFQQRILDWAPAILSNKKVLKNEVHAPVVKRVVSAGKSEADYQGLKAVYRTEKNTSGSGTVIRSDWKNTNMDVIAVVSVRNMNGDVMKELKVGPGAAATEVISGESMVRIVIRFEPGKETGPGTLEKLKIIVNEQVEEKPDGKILLFSKKSL